MKANNILGGLILVSLVLAVPGCTDLEKENAKVLDQVAGDIDREFQTIRTANDNLKAAIDTLYKERSSLDLATDRLDVADGGVFQLFDGYNFYYKTVKEGASYYISPQKPLTQDIKTEVRFLQYVEPALAKAGEASPWIATAFYGIEKPITMAMFYPHADVISFFPPGLPVGIFEFFQRGMKSSGESLWSSKPFTDLARGWVMDVAAPTISQDNKAGVATISVSLAKMNTEYIRKLESPVLVLSKEGTLVGASAKAKSLLKVQMLEDYDYVKQMKENTFAPEVLNLSHESQPLSVRAIASQIQSGASSFLQDINGQKYGFLVKKLQEVDFTVVLFYRM